MPAQGRADLSLSRAPSEARSNGPRGPPTGATAVAGRAEAVAAVESPVTPTTDLQDDPESALVGSESPEVPDFAGGDEVRLTATDPQVTAEAASTGSGAREASGDAAGGASAAAADAATLATAPALALAATAAPATLPVSDGGDGPDAAAAGAGRPGSPTPPGPGTGGEDDASLGWLDDDDDDDDDAAVRPAERAAAAGGDVERSAVRERHSTEVMFALAGQSPDGLVRGRDLLRLFRLGGFHLDEGAFGDEYEDEGIGCQGYLRGPAT